LAEKGVDTTSVKNYVDRAAEEMTRRYTHLTEEHAKRTAGKLDGLYPVANVLGNKVETIERKQEGSQNPPPANA